MESDQKTKLEPTIIAAKAARYLLTLIILGLAVHLILPQLASFQHSYAVIKDLVIWAFVLAVVAQACSYLGSGYLLTALVKLSNGSLSLIKGSVITLAGYSFGMVAGGMVGSSAATYRWMQKEDVPPEAATLAGTIPALFNDIVLLFVSMVGLAHLLIVHQLTRLQGVSFAVILVVLVGLIALLIWGLRKRESLTLRAGKFGHWWAAIRKREYHPEKTEAGLNNLFNAADMLVTGGWRGPLFGAAIGVFFDMLTLYFLFIAAGYPIRFGVLLTGYGLPMLLGKMAFMFPGGVGIIESTMTGIYASLGLPDAVTIVVVLVYRILSFWLPLLLGFPLVLFLQHKNNGENSLSERS